MLATMPTAIHRGNSLGILEGHIPHGVLSHRKYYTGTGAYRSVCSQPVPIMLAHLPQFTIGHTSELREDPSGLRFSVAIPDNELGHQLLAARRCGYFAMCSTHTAKRSMSPADWHGISCYRVDHIGELLEITLTCSPMQPKAVNTLAGVWAPDEPSGLPSDFLSASRIQTLLEATGEADDRCQPLPYDRWCRQEGYIEQQRELDQQMEEILAVARQQPGQILTAEQHREFLALDAEWDRLHELACELAS